MWYDPLSYIDIAGVYLSNPYLFDALILLTIFLGISQYVFTQKNHFGKRHGKTLAVAVSFALTLSSILFMSRQGWNLATPGVSVIPFTIIFLLLYYLMYKILEDVIGVGKLCAGSIAYLLTYPGVLALFGDVVTSLSGQYYWLGWFLSLLMLIAIVSFFICIGQFFSGIDMPKKKKTDTESNNAANKQNKSKTPKEDSEPPQKLRVAINEPTGPYTQNTPIPLQATIVGGQGRYVTQATLESTGQEIQRQGNKINIEFDNPGEGTHTIAVRVTDGEQEITSTADFEVINDLPETIEISGQALAYLPNQDDPVPVTGTRIDILRPARNGAGIGGNNLEPALPGKSYIMTDRLLDRRGKFSFNVPNQQAIYVLRGEWEHEGIRYIGLIDPRVGSLRQREDQRYIHVPEKHNEDFEVLIRFDPIPGQQPQQQPQEPGPEEPEVEEAEYEDIEENQEPENQDTQQETEDNQQPQNTQQPTKNKQEEVQQDTDDSKQSSSFKPPKLTLEVLNLQGDGFIELKKDKYLAEGIKYTNGLRNHVQLFFSINKEGGAGKQFVKYYLAIAVRKNSSSSSEWLSSKDLRAMNVSISAYQNKDFINITSNNQDRHYLTSEPVQIFSRKEASPVRIVIGNPEQAFSWFEKITDNGKPLYTEMEFYLLAQLVDSQGQRNSKYKQEPFDVRARILITRPKDS